MSTVLGSIVCAGNYLDFSPSDMIIFASHVPTAIIFRYMQYINTLLAHVWLLTNVLLEKIVLLTRISGLIMHEYAYHQAGCEISRLRYFDRFTRIIIFPICARQIQYRHVKCHVLSTRSSLDYWHSRIVLRWVTRSIIDRFSMISFVWWIIRERLTMSACWITRLLVKVVGTRLISLRFIRWRLHAPTNH